MHMNWLKKAQNELIVAFTTSIGCSFVFLAIPKTSKMFAVLIGVGFTIILVFLILRKLQIDTEKEHYEIEKGELEKKRHILEKTLEKERQESLMTGKDEALNLLVKANEYSTSIMRVISGDLQKFQKSMLDGKIEFSRVSMSENILIIKENIIQLVLDRIKLLFEGDTRGIKDTSFPHTYFKVALFELKKIDEKMGLKRVHCVYPDGIEPGGKTGFVDIEHNKRCAHVLSYSKPVMSG